MFSTTSMTHTSSVSGSVVQTQELGSLTPQLVVPLGPLGKEQTLPVAEGKFFFGMELDLVKQTSCQC